MFAMSEKRFVMMSQFFFIALLLGSFALLTACVGFADKPSEATGPRPSFQYYSLNESGVAIDGYSPVSYFEEGKPQKGTEEFAVTHRGIIYYLTNTEQVTLFQSNPEKYEPAHGGWCSLMLSGSGKLTRVNPESN